MWHQIREEWISSSQNQKIATIIILLALIPLVILVINHIGNDFDIQGGPYQHMESIYHAVHGKPVYAPLSTEYQSITHAPLFWFLSAILCKLFGMSFFWPRLVSVLASIGCAIILFRWTWRLTDHNFPLSVAAPIIFLCANFITMSTFLVEVSVDETHYFFSLLGFYLLINPTRRNTILAAIACSAAVLAKQTALAYVAAAVVMLFFRARRQTPVFLGLVIAMLGVSFWYLNTYEGEFYRQIVSANAGVLWQGERVFSEVLPFFLKTTGFMLLFALVHLMVDDCFDQHNFWQRIWKCEYVMTAAGLAVAIIATPKLGSGVPTHCFIAIAGITLCGMAGLHQTVRLMPKTCSERICLGVALAQVFAILLLAIPTYPACLIDRYDREKAANISNVFKAGRTCLFGLPYIQHQHNQAAAGVPDDDPTKWKNGRFTYDFIPEELLRPFKKQEFDYVIVGTYYFDPNHPVVKAIQENYKTVLGRFPAHPKYPRTATLRHDCYVLQANRLQPVPQSNPPASQP